MTYPTVPLGSQWTHRTLPTQADMQARIDAPLNAAAAKLRAGLGDNRLVVSLTTTTALASGSVVKFDDVRSDPLGAYSPTTGLWTCPADGLYLMSVRLTVGNAASSIAARINNLDTTIYPQAIWYSGTTASAIYETSELPAVPIIAKAGQTYSVGLFVAASGTWTPDNATSPTVNLRNMWTIDYVGKFAGVPNPGTDPASPLVPVSPWANGEPVPDVKLYHRFDQNADTLQPYVNDWGAQQVSYLGTYLNKPITAGAPIAWDTAFDTSGGWDPVAKVWAPQTAGLYLITAGCRITADQDLSFSVNLGSYEYYGQARAAGAGVGRFSFLSAIVQLDTFDTVYARCDQSGTSQSTFSTWLGVVQLG